MLRSVPVPAEHPESAMRNPRTVAWHWHVRGPSRRHFDIRARGGQTVRPQVMCSLSFGIPRQASRWRTSESRALM